MHECMQCYAASTSLRHTWEGWRWWRWPWPCCGCCSCCLPCNWHRTARHTTHVGCIGSWLQKTRDHVITTPKRSRPTDTVGFRVHSKARPCSARPAPQKLFCMTVLQALRDAAAGLATYLAKVELAAAALALPLLLPLDLHTGTSGSVKLPYSPYSCGSLLVLDPFRHTTGCAVMQVHTLAEQLCNPSCMHH